MRLLCIQGKGEAQVPWYGQVLLESTASKTDFVFSFESVWYCLVEWPCNSLRKPAVSEHPGAGLTGGYCETPPVGAGNQTWELRKNRTCSELLNRLSSTYKIIFKHIKLSKIVLLFMWYSQLFMKYTKCRVGNRGRLLTLQSASRFLMRLDKRIYKSPEHSCLHTHSWFSLSDRLFPFCYMNIIHVSNTRKIPYLKKILKDCYIPRK